MSSSSQPLTPGVCYTAQVSSRQGDGTYRVTVDDPKVSVSGVLLALPAIGGHLGLQIRGNLPQLTKVKIVYGAPSFIIAVLPDGTADVANGFGRSMIWGAKMDAEQGVTGNAASDHAEDLLEGEVEFANLYGVTLQFLTTLMRMTAGDRAAVECHLINDMVRVISGQWSHISGLGEDLIFDHGRPTMERGWSMYRHEVLGALNEKVPYAAMNGDEVDREVLESERVTATGRHRFVEFIGFAGDFIHSFVTDPAATVVSLAADAAKSGAGKSWMHRNSDGSVLVQSVAEIRFERVCRIPVPVRYQHHEAPEVTSAREYDKLNEEFVEIPKSISPVDPKDAFQLAYHLRSYSRWLGRYHSFARMLQLEHDYLLQSEAASPTPDWTNGETDRQKKNGVVSYYDAYACFAIMRDGSIVTHDGYGSSVTMSNGNVQVSAARHIDLEAAGDIRMLAGGSIFMKARRNIELSATMGGLILHSYAWIRALCEKGTVWLRSNAATDKAIAPEPKTPGAPTPEIAGWESGQSDGFAVLVEAAAGAAAYRSLKGNTIAVDGSPADADDHSYDLQLVTPADLNLRGNREASLQSARIVSLSAAQQVTVSSPKVVADAAEVSVVDATGSPGLSLRGGRLWVDALDTDRVNANGIYGPERGPSIPDPDLRPLESLKPHLNHINKLTAPVEKPADVDAATKATVAAAKLRAVGGLVTPWGSPGAGPEWSFPGKEEYAWDPREKVKGVVPETLTQQYLRLDAVVTNPDRWGGLGYGDWDVRHQISGPRTHRSGGFGYYELQYQADDAGESLHAPSATAPADMEKMKTSWRPRAKFTLKCLKREGEQ